MRQRKLKPMVTLHHFSNPLWIEQQGGWANPETVDHFARFVRRTVEALGSQVTMWCTINEPMIYSTQSYLFGKFPPGKHSPALTWRVIEHLLRGHAAAFRTIKDLRPGAQVGLAKHQVSLKPRFPQPLNLPALRLARFFFNEMFVEALMTGVLRLPGRTVRVPEVSGTLDWIGLNYYYRFAAGFNLFKPHQLFIDISRPRAGIPGPGGQGEIWPEGLFGQIKWLSEATRKPIYITENGVADPEDRLRPLHMIRSLQSVWQAINHNYPVKGYYWWTLADNFEWSEGYDPRFRFGLYGCDPETQQRTRRRSAELYGEICAANALTAEMIRRYLPPEQYEDLLPEVRVKAEIDLPQREG
jgi:beta-glucosidase